MKALADNAEFRSLRNVGFLEIRQRYRALRIPLRAFFALFFAVFLLVFLAAAVLAALLDRRAAVFFATFPADLLTVLFGLVLAFAARLRAVRFLRGA